VAIRSLRVHRRAIYATCGSVAGVGATFVFLASTVWNIALPTSPVTLAILLLVGATLPPGMINFDYARWRRRIDNAIPQLLSDMTGDVKTGVSLMRTLENSARRDYGPLTAELSIAKAQLSWGVSLEDAITSLVRRVDTVLVRRIFTLIVEADKAGGKTDDLLDAVQKHAVELRNIEKERTATLRPYIVVTYIAFFVFLAVAVLLTNSFFSNIAQAQGNLQASGGGGIFSGLAGLDVGSIKQTFFQMSLIESVFGGLGAGKLGEMSFGAGFKHVLIMVVATLLVFTVFVGI